jgi:hypothetical protein
LPAESKPEKDITSRLNVKPASAMDTGKTK